MDYIQEAEKGVDTMWTLVVKFDVWLLRAASDDLSELVEAGRCISETRRSQRPDALHVMQHAK